MNVIENNWYILIKLINANSTYSEAELFMGWVDPQIGLGWVEYDNYTTYNCIPVEFLGSSDYH